MLLRLYPRLRAVNHLSRQVRRFSSLQSSTTLEGRHALITGGSRGIGLAIAKCLAQHSCCITLLSRNEDDLKSALNSLNSIPSRYISHSYIVGDVSSKEFWKSDPKRLPRPRSEERDAEPFERRGYEAEIRAREETTESVLDERVDILVNCAGIAQNSLFSRTAPEDIERIVQTNLMGTMLTIRHLQEKRAFRPSKSSWAQEPAFPGGQIFKPVIINLSSLLGVKGGRGAAAYSASKAGVLGLTRALAAELGPIGIRVNAIVPGYIETQMTSGMGSKLSEMIPLKRFGHVDEIADAALFLVMNQYANNCTINLDGGLSAT